MGRQCLLPLELADCLTDSPHFRQNLHAYEKELENTNASIKSLVKDIKEVLDATKQLSRCHRAFASSLDKFQFHCIGGSQTDDEIVIAGSLKQFAALINQIEEERQRMLDYGHKHIIGALDNFRRTHIGAAKEGRKKFEKQTQKFCASLERHLNLSTKKLEDQAMKEADASLDMEQRYFVQASLDYVCMLQEVQERKKFEFVETLLGCMYGWLTFYHQGHEMASDYKGQMTDLQMRLQKTREEFEATRSEVESLKNKMMLDVRQTKSMDAGTRQGYLYLMEKKAFGTTWTKHYCKYDKKTKSLSLIPYNQLTGKLSSSDQMVLKSCVRRMSETIDRRFCFDVTAEERDGQVYTLQAMSEDDRRLWMDAMDGKEPTYSKYGLDQRAEETALDENGFHFISSLIAQLEGRGLEEQGLYRVVGVSSKVTKLVQLGLSRQKFDKLALDNVVEWETKTLTSAIKTYFRNLPEPLMTFRLHHEFINAAKTDNREVRVAEIHKLVRKLPKDNYCMLKKLMQHAQNVSRKSDKNLMSVSNLGVCFGPTLLRPEEETMAAIIDIKFCNTVVEILIKHFDTIFSGGPVPTVVESNGQLHYSNGPLSGAPAPVKPGIIAATAQPVQVTAYEAEQPARSARPAGGVPGSARRHFPPPPYAHPPPPVYAPPPGQHPSPPGGSALPPPAAAAAASEQPLRQKALHVFNPNSYSERERFEGGSLTNNSMSSSNESLSSRSSRDLHQTTNSSSSSPYTRGKLGIVYPPSYRSQPDMSPPTTASSTAPPTGLSSSQSLLRRVRTLYACVGENDSELSFEPNQIITNVRPSREPGWLEGTLNGHPGLVPENYVEYLP